MTSLFVHVGQAGCQMGQSFWSPLVEDIKENETMNLAFAHQNRRDLNQHRSIFIDTEPKALREAMKSIGAKRIGPCIQFGTHGRGSCFSMGFHHGLIESDLDSNFDFIRQEVERCDYFSGFVMFHSLGGGTGSGLGSRLAGWLRDSYPMAHLLNVSCMGFRNESAIQNYNAILSLSHLQANSDGIILVNNDVFFDQLTNQSVFDINEQICLSLHGCFLPSTSLNSNCKLRSGAPISFNSEPWELLHSVSPMPSNKFMHTDSVSQSSEKPDLSLVGSLARQVKKVPISNDPSHKKNIRFLSMLVIERNGATLTKDGIKKLSSSVPFVPWNPFPCDVWKGDDNIALPYLKDKRNSCFTCCSNSNKFIPFVSQLIEKTQELVSVGAFLHWYEKFGCDRNEVLNAAECVNDIVNAYDEI